MRVKTETLARFLISDVQFRAWVLYHTNDGESFNRRFQRFLISLSRLNGSEFVDSALFLKEEQFKVTSNLKEFFKDSLLKISGRAL